MCGNIDSSVESQVVTGGDDLVGWRESGAMLGGDGAGVRSESCCPGLLWMVQVVLAVFEGSCCQGTCRFTSPAVQWRHE